MNSPPLAVFAHCCGSCQFVHMPIIASYDKDIYICLWAYEPGSKNMKAAKVSSYNICNKYVKSNKL